MPYDKSSQPYSAQGFPNVDLDYLLSRIRYHKNIERKNIKSKTDKSRGESSSLAAVVENYPSEVDPRFGLSKETQVGIQTYVPEESVILPGNANLELGIIKIYISPELESKGLRKMLEEAYKEFKKKRTELSNKDAYYKFFEAYINAHLLAIGRDPEVIEEFYSDILPVLKKHPTVHSINLKDIRFYGDGKWEVVRIELMPEFRGHNGKLLNFYRKLWDMIPEEFIAPEVAGLQSPFQARYWMLHPNYRRPQSEVK